MGVINLEHIEMAKVVNNNFISEHKLALQKEKKTSYIGSSM